MSLYRNIIKPLLFSLSNERAYQTAIWTLRVVGLMPLGKWLLKRLYAYRHPLLEREVLGLHFPNPVGLAAGFDRTGELCRELSAMGFGFVEVGTVTPQPQDGNPKPRLFRLPKDSAIVHRLGHPNRGLKRAIHNLRRERRGVVVGCNIGRNIATAPEKAAQDYLKSFRSLYEYADYFAVNLYCDNSINDCAVTKEYIESILAPLFDFRRGQNCYRPIMLKISPDMSDESIDMIADILLTTPLDGIVATNGTNSREGLKTNSGAVNKIGSGRIGGAPLTQRSVEIVRRIHTRSGGEYPIIGVGGLMTPNDVLAMLDAGADLVQLYSGFVYGGPNIIKEVCSAIVQRAENELLNNSEQQS